MTVVIALEGMPCSGKTSALATLVANLRDDCLAFPETNPTPGQLRTLHGLEPQELNKWYLDRELARSLEVDACAHVEKLAAVALDRTWLGALAHSFAMGGGRSSRLFRNALAHYRSALKPRITPPHLTVLFKQTIDLSVKRRALKPIEPASPEWSESGFIAATATFYDEEAHDLLESPVILFQAGLYADFGSLMRALGIAVDSFWGSAEWRAGVDLVPISRLPTPLESKDRHFPDTGQIISDDLIWAYFRSHGRAATLGSPMGATLQYFGRPTQYFGRHALRIAESGKVICWQPHLKDLL